MDDKLGMYDDVKYLKYHYDEDTLNCCCLDSWGWHKGVEPGDPIIKITAILSELLKELYTKGE